MRCLYLFLTGAALVVQPSRAAADETAEIIVVTATPLGQGRGAQLLAAADLERSRATSLAEQLARTAPGVSINEIQGNPLQPDISYRGFTASPLLGTPQGLAIWLDGVRLNQPFGETVSWDLLPIDILAGVELVSGAAPQFGRNALGGALVLHSKDGRSDPGVGIQASAGSFGRATLAGQGGGVVAQRFDWFVAADHFRDAGWRDLSPSRATRGYGKVGWGDGDSRITASALFGTTDLAGNGLQEQRLLEAQRRSIYTAPDQTLNRHLLVNLAGEHRLSPGVVLRGNLFWRRLDGSTLNGDVNEAALGENPYQPTAIERAALAAAGYSGFPQSNETQANTPFPKWRCIANALRNDEPNEKCNGLLGRSATRQREWGANAELVHDARLLGVGHRLTVGAGYVRSRSDFVQTAQFGYVLPDRTIAAVDGPGAFADGTQSSENAFDARVNLGARVESIGAYLLETVSAGAGWQIDLAGRYDVTRFLNRDRITPGGGPGSLDTDSTYRRFNPSAAVRWRPAERAEVSLSWSQASRAPSAIELGCADPATPCRLPNAMAGDPPLQQVVARTIELQGRFGTDVATATVTLFRSDNSNDILFVAADTSGYGYFRNFGRTRRQGIEVAGRLRVGAVILNGSYTLLDATYRSPEIVGGGSNSSSDAVSPGFDGNIAVVPGNRIPLLPRHSVKLSAIWSPRPWLDLNLDMAGFSGVYARGNENNRHQPDGIVFLGPGATRGFLNINLGAEVRPGGRWSVFATIRNLADSHYASAAQLGTTAFDRSGRFVARPFSGPVIGGERPLLHATFLAPGASRSIEAGARLRF